MTHHTTHEFGNMLHALANDIIDAHAHWYMATDLQKAMSSHTIVAAQSITFWRLTCQAHETTALQCLARAFDQEQSSLHLPSFLKTIQDNIEIFDVEDFRERLKNNPFVESLAAAATRPDEEILRVDMQQCSTGDPHVKRLVSYRSSYAAHRSKKLTLRPQVVDQKLPDTDVETLLARALIVLNRYSHMFSAATYSTFLVGRDDYQYIFSAVEEAVHRVREQRRLKKPDSNSRPS